MTKPKVEPDRIVENIQRREPSGVEGAGRRFTLASALIVLGVALGIFLVWRTSSSLLIIFAGILFASFLDACTRALGSVVPLGRAWRLTLVILSLTALIVLGAMWGIGKIPEQARLLIRVMDAQLDILQQRLLSIGVELFGPDGSRDLSRWFPDRQARSVSPDSCRDGVQYPGQHLALRSRPLFRLIPEPIAMASLLVKPRCDPAHGRLDEWAVSCAPAGRATYPITMTMRSFGAFFAGASGCVSSGASRFVDRLTRADPRCLPGRTGSNASRLVDGDLGSRDLYRHTVHRGLRDRPSHPASGGGTASGMDTGGHRPVRFPVRRMGHCTCDAAICNRSCCRPPALC